MIRGGCWIVAVSALATWVLMGACSSVAPPSTDADADADAADETKEVGSGTADASNVQTDGGNAVVDAPDEGEAIDGGDAPEETDAGAPCGMVDIDIGSNAPGGIRGTITMPTPVPRELVGIEISYFPDATYAFNVSLSGASGGPTKSTYTFRVPSPGPNGYWLRASAHADISNLAFDENDYTGFHSGGSTVAGPWQALKITGATPACGADIVIGKPVCYKQWGTTCADSAECRRVVCQCNGGGASLSAAYCDPVSLSCAALPGFSCEGKCGAAGLKELRQADCFGN